MRHFKRWNAYKNWCSIFLASIPFSKMTHIILFYFIFPMHDILWVPIKHPPNITRKQQKPIFFNCDTLCQVNALGAICCQNKHPSTPLKCCLFGNTPFLGLYLHIITWLKTYITNLPSFIRSYKFHAKSYFHRFVQISHEFCVTVNMNDIFMYSIS
jgi:hypothetical protein